jgi:hypothetical protein
MPTRTAPAPEAVRAACIPQHPGAELPWIRNAEAPPMDASDELLDMTGMDAFPASDPPYLTPPD